MALNLAAAISPITRVNTHVHYDHEIHDHNDIHEIDRSEQILEHMHNGIAMYLDGSKDDFLTQIELSSHSYGGDSQTGQSATLMHGMLRSVYTGREIDPEAFSLYTRMLPAEVSNRAAGLLNHSNALKEKSLKFTTSLRKFNKGNSSLNSVYQHANEYEQERTNFFSLANKFIADPTTDSSDTNSTGFDNQYTNGLYNQVFANSLGVNIANIKHINVIWASMLLFILCYENSNHLAANKAQSISEVNAVQSRLNLLTNSTAKLNNALTNYAGSNENTTVSDMINNVFNKNNLSNKNAGVIRSQVRSYLHSLVKGQSASFLNTKIAYNGGVSTIGDAVKNLLSQTSPNATEVNTQNIANGIGDVINGMAHNINNGLTEAHDSAYDISYNQNNLTTADLHEITTQSASSINSLSSIKSSENLEISRYLSNSQAFMSMSSNANKIYSSTMNAVTSF